MDEILLYGAVSLAVILIMSGIIAKAFEKIAGEKGYSGYFWWCFLLGLVGWIMVAALPNKRAVAPAPAAPSRTDELERLARLHTQGVLTDGEFELMKGKILSRI